MNPKLYLAGPEVFLPNALEIAENQRKICRKYDFIPIHPLDNTIDVSGKDEKTAMRIYRGDVGQIHACDIVVANCNGFRGVCMDDGTAYELGYANALQKPSYGYIRERTSLLGRTIRDYKCEQLTDGVWADKDGYLVEDFSLSINLMMQCGMLFRGGMLVSGDFEACLKVLRADIDAGVLKI